MIIVTGTKRSGTSMWMQILKAADFPILGNPFSKDWETTIRDANPEGFYESPFRNGINYQSNPDPNTGIYVAPRQSKPIAVKVFIPGLARSDLAFVDHVIACVRPWREYYASITRLYTMEKKNRSELKEEGASKEKVPEQLDYIHPVLEWWDENFELVRDFVMRQYPIHVVPYQQVLTQPEATIRETLNWVSDGNLEASKMQAAVDVVKPKLATVQGAAPTPDLAPLDLPDGAIPMFDELTRRLSERVPLDGDFIDTMNDLHDALEPKIEVTRRFIQNRRRKQIRKRATKLAEARKAEAGDDAVAAPSKNVQPVLLSIR